MDRSVDELWRKAQVCMCAGDRAAARSVLESLLLQAPRHAAAHMTMSHIAWADGRVRDAARHALDTARDFSADDPMAIIALSMALLRAGETVAARECLEHPVLAHARSGQVVMCHAGLRRELGEDARALRLFDRAHALGVEGAEFRFARGLEHVICDHAREAESDFEASLRMDPRSGAATLELARLRVQTPERNHLEELERRRSRVLPGSVDRAALEFARYKELEDIGRYEEAWAALTAGNGIMRALHSYDPLRTRRQVDALIATLSQRVPEPDAASKEEGPRPIFILGLPRSGTTLLDRLLGSHSQVVSAGELEDFSRQMCWAADQPEPLGDPMLQALTKLDYREIGHRYLAQTQWRAGAARFFIDKQPWHYMLAGLIRLALPGARLLHLVRDPIDVCFSSYRALLGGKYGYSFDLHALPGHFLEYRRLMSATHAASPGTILDVSYNELVTATEATMRKVLSFCGLKWEPACLDPSRNTTAVATLSAMQARGPVHAGASGAWRPYRRHLEELRQQLPA